jgi:cytochrome c2
MTCTTGDRSCDVPRRRGALAVLAGMAAIFIALSWFSFVDERGQATPDQFSYQGHAADEGKRVFQAYNCMGCHTIVGNGAYLGPDLTNIYQDAGPAWLEAFLPSAGSWPTEVAVRAQLANPKLLAAAEVESADAYLSRYPGAVERIQRRGGSTSHMPNLAFREGEVAKLIAFLKYSSAMHTEGWPPRVRTGSLERRLGLLYGAAVPSAQAANAAQPAVAAAAVASSDPVAHGAKLVKDYGCTACHATDASRTIGPGWGGVHGSQVPLADGSTVLADDAYLAESIRDPGARIVRGYPAGTMPSYDALLKDGDLEAMVAYLSSLTGPETH